MIMKLMINHQTHYKYTETAKNSIQYIKMMPQTVCQVIRHSKEIFLIIFG